MVPINEKKRKSCTFLTFAASRRWHTPADAKSAVLIAIWLIAIACAKKTPTRRRAEIDAPLDTCLFFVRKQRC
jgi:hypothetical protein